MTGRLENWRIEKRGPYLLVWGNIYEDVNSRWVEGTLIHTSAVDTPEDQLAEGVLIQTLNSTYLLGVPYVKPTAV